MDLCLVFQTFKCTKKDFSFNGLYSPVTAGRSRDRPSRGTQRIVSVNYLFGRPLIPSDFLKRTVASNFRDTRNLMSCFRSVKAGFH